MSWSQSDLDALDNAIKAGVKRVRYKDHEAEYHSLTEMLQLRGAMKAEIASAAGQNGSVILAGRIPC